MRWGPVIANTGKVLGALAGLWAAFDHVHAVAIGGVGVALVGLSSALSSAFTGQQVEELKAGHAENAAKIATVEQVAGVPTPEARS